MEYLGLRTVIYSVENINKAKEWYRQVLGFGPYFDQPFYVGFNVGGFELGLIPSEGKTNENAKSVFAYWGVEDAKKSFARLIEMGATLNEQITDVGGGILTGTVIDPFDNVFGVIENPHFPNKE